MDYIETSKKKTPNRVPWLWPLRDEDRCTARSKRTGKRCGRRVSPGKKVCYYHGGRSSGPRTKEGKERIAQAHLVHGEETLSNLKIRTLSWALHDLWQTGLRNTDFNAFGGWLITFIHQQNSAKFAKARAHLMEFRRGEIRLNELLSRLYERREMYRVVDSHPDERDFFRAVQDACSTARTYARDPALRSFTWVLEEHIQNVTTKSKRSSILQESEIDN